MLLSNATSPRLGALLVGLLLAIAAPRPALADREATQEAMERLEEILELRTSDGVLSLRDVAPTILVEARPRYEASQGWFRIRALNVLTTVFGSTAVRLCEACMRLRTDVQPGRIEQSTGPIGLDEIIALDERYRGSATPARSAVWFEEIKGGVAVRIIDLSNGRVVFARNIEPDLRSYRGSARRYTLTQEYERRVRGESLTHIFFDMALFPGQHVSLEFVDQFGASNANLAGFVFSLFDPILGVGLSYHRVLEFQNMTVGGQVLLSVPTAIARGVANADIDIIDPAVTGAVLLRYPFGNSNYAAVASVSTNGNFGLGVTLLNTTSIPILP